MGCTERCVAELIRRVRHEEDFPHEIGLFLGYPSEDVSGFIKHGAKIQNVSALGRFTVTKRRHRKNSSFIKNAQECIKTLTKAQFI